MRLWRGLGQITVRHEERQLDLKGGGAQEPGDLGLGHDLLGHEVEQGDTHRSDVDCHHVFDLLDVYHDS